MMNIKLFYADSSNLSKNIKPIQEVPAISEPAYAQNQSVQQTNQSLNNSQCLACSVINYANGNASCIGKLVLLPNYALNAQIICDINFNSYLCTYNQQTNQYNCIGNIIFEPSGEYAVYQGYQKVGTLCYHSFEGLV